MTLTFTPARTEAQIAAIADLAHIIWHEYYVPLIGREQVDYMLARFQSVAAMRAQLDEGYEYFAVLRQATPVGYIAMQPRGDGLFVSKFYLLAAARGQGTGRAMMAFIEDCVRERGLGRLWLTVNKGNPAVQAYERLGLRTAESIVVDIGGGFVMDDYRMEKVLA